MTLPSSPIKPHTKPYDMASMQSNWLIVMGAFLLAAYMLFAHLGGLALISPDEGRNAEVAREMSQSHAWLVPTYDGLVYLDKPAFYFKTVALSFSLFGESEGVARLSSAVFGFLLVIAAFLFCRKMYDQRTAILATLIITSTPLYIAYSRIVIFDMTLAFFVSCAIFSCYLAEEYEGKQRARWYFLGAIAAGFATLVKGPVGFIIPSLVIIVFHAFDGQWKPLKRVFAWRNWVIFFVIVLPWFIGLSLLRPDFPYYGIMRESVARFTTTEFRRTAPFYYYGSIIGITFFAWSFLLPEAIVAAWKNRKKWSRTDRLLIIWAIVVVIFFSISQSKLPNYILTAVMVLGILTARLFALALNNNTGRAAHMIWRGTFPLFLLSALAALVLFIVAFNPELLKSRLSVKSTLIDLFIPSILPMAVSFAVVAMIAICALWKRSAKLIFVAFISFPILLMTVNFDVLSLYAASRSTRSLANSIPKSLPPTTELVCMECLPHGLPFYTKRLVTVLTNKGEELTSNYVIFTLNSGKPWPEGIVPKSDWDHWITTRQHPIYLMGDTAHLSALETIARDRGAKIEKLDTKYWGTLLLPSLGN